MLIGSGTATCSGLIIHYIKLSHKTCHGLQRNDGWCVPGARMQVHTLRAIIPALFSHILASCKKKLLTSKFRYVFIRCMHARNVSVTKVAHRVLGDLSARKLNVDNRSLSLLILVSLIVLLIIGRGAGLG